MILHPAMSQPIIENIRMRFENAARATEIRGRGVHSESYESTLGADTWQLSGLLSEIATCFQAKSRILAMGQDIPISSLGNG